MAVSTIKRMTSEYETIVNSANVNAGNVTLYNGRRLSKYSLIQVSWIVSNRIRASVVMPRGTLANGVNLELFYVDSANTQRWADVNCVNDTTVNISCSANASGSILAVGII